MTVKEILNKITKQDVYRAIDSFNINPYGREIELNQYTLLINGNPYPARELIMRASNRELENAENKSSFTSIVAKSRLIELGFTEYSEDNLMFKFYLKKTSNQDKIRTAVLNKEAIKSFFGVKLQNEEATVSVRYLPSNLIDKEVKILMHQDPRIFIERTIFNTGDILLFTKNENGIFDLETIAPNDHRYNAYSASLANNYLLTNSLPLVSELNLAADSIVEYKSLIMKQPLNQILYGPPGTGKTYSTITRALNIIGLLEEKDIYTNEEYETALELFQNELGKRIEFVTMHQSFSYEDFVQGLKPKKTEDGKSLSFEYKNGVFKEICERAEDNITGDAAKKVRTLNNREICKIAFYLSKYNGKKKGEKKANEVLKYQSDNYAFIGIGKIIGEKPNSIKNHRDKFDFMFKDRESYTSRNGWTPRNNKGELDNTKKWPYKDIYDELNPKSFEEVSSIVKDLLRKKSPISEEIEGNQNYVIIIDEINRANISKVFGELITLIEDDKREAISTTLPSGESFTVPKNLYIIGTMNTADRSISNMDIALRRRFEFIPLYPNKDLVKDEYKRTFMENINNVLKWKGIDFQVGHADFMKELTLVETINKKTIPLLMEYYRNDSEQVKKYISEALPKTSGIITDFNQFGIPEVSIKNMEI